MKLSSKRSLYAHIPFCERKCFYCSFAVAVGQKQRVDQYVDCILKEAMHYNSQEISTIYIGGGTPTFMSCAQLDNFLSGLKKYFVINPNNEFTVEANPEGLTKEKLQCLQSHGVNRISLGVQTFNDQHLKFLGRVHDSSQAKAAFDIVRASGFKNISVDLMFGFPKQAQKDLESDIEKICALGSEHISIYALTVEPNSRFFAQSLTLKDEAVQVQEYSFIIKALRDNGYDQYEVSNFAKPGFESAHNKHYWLCHEYIGLGMGAHSFVDGARYANAERLLEYIKMIKDDASAMKEKNAIDTQERLTEALLFGLRMNEGVDVSVIERRFSLSLRKDQEQTIQQMVNDDFLKIQSGRLMATEKGRLVLDMLCAKLY